MQRFRNCTFLLARSQAAEQPQPAVDASLDSRDKAMRFQVAPGTEQSARFSNLSRAPPPLQMSPAPASRPKSASSSHSVTAVRVLGSKTQRARPASSRATTAGKPRKSRPSQSTSGKRPLKVWERVQPRKQKYVTQKDNEGIYYHPRCVGRSVDQDTIDAEKTQRKKLRAQKEAQEKQEREEARV